MKIIKIIEILLLMLSVLCFLGSHLLFVLSNYINSALFFSIEISLDLFIDVLLGLSIFIPFIIVILILKD